MSGNELTLNMQMNLKCKWCVVNKIHAIRFFLESFQWAMNFFFWNICK